MRIPLFVVACAALLPATVPAHAGGSDAGGGPAPAAGRVLAAKAPLDGAPVRPDGPNPYLSLLPDPARPDLAAWNRYLTDQGRVRAASAAAAPAATPLLVDEDEPVGLRGSNDAPATAQPVPGFGSTPGRTPAARVLGTLSPEPAPAVRLAPSAEDDGSIPLARATGIGGRRHAVVTSGVIGDGPHGRAAGGTGDVDFYRLRATAGQTISAQVRTPDSPLDSVVAVYDAAGRLVALNDDFGGRRDSLLSHTVVTTGTYYVLVTGFPVLPDDPSDPASGQGAGSEGSYSVRITAAEADLDHYALRLRKGDVLGASGTGAARRLAVLDPAPRIEDVHGSSQDVTVVYPAASPLPGGGAAVVDHVVDQDGWHYLAVEAVGHRGGDYDVTVEVHRPALEPDGRVQTVFLDFDGARVNTGIFGGPGVRELTPLRAFLGRWGLRNADLDRLVTATVAEVRENVRRDLVQRGGTGVAVRILNSRDHADPWGQPDVSRIVVGGTIAESGIETIGIAQSIDPGNFETEETALVLLDLLSERAGPATSLNTYLRPGSARVAFVAQAVGNVVAHEAGHVLGNWHVDQFNDRPNLMDQGGNFPVLYGVGPDGVGGTADDPDVDFGQDVFNPNEGFTGIEDTLTRTAFGLLD